MLVVDRLVVGCLVEVAKYCSRVSTFLVSRNPSFVEAVGCESGTFVPIAGTRAGSGSVNGAFNGAVVGSCGDLAAASIVPVRWCAGGLRVLRLVRWFISSCVIFVGAGVVGLRCGVRPIVAPAFVRLLLSHRMC